MKNLEILSAQRINDIGPKQIQTMEEILYTILNIGFSSLEAQESSIVYKYLCLESYTLRTILDNNCNQISTSNLLSLFCFHLSRIPAKVDKRLLIPIFEQDRLK
jgi:RNA polymerase sigma-70 factor (ECF subfamily)